MTLSSSPRRLKVRREPSTHMGLFGDVHVWAVWATPWQKVATFTDWHDAVWYARLYSIALSRTEATRS